jgi:hypothetical protein
VKAPSAATLVAVPAVLVAVLIGVLLGVLLVPSATAATQDPTAPTGTCAAGVDKPFVPKVMAIEHVTKRAKVLAVGREPHSRIPKTPPLSTAGKWQVAWDRQGVRPGSARGTAIFDAHTWPWSEPPALGNRMLRRLHEGDQITVWGKHQVLCYTITRRTSINVRQKDPKGFFSTTGTPQIVITVCSGKRRGPGDWSRRTYWFARPFVPTSVLGPPPMAPPPEPPKKGGLLGLLGL